MTLRSLALRASALSFLALAACSVTPSDGPEAATSADLATVTDSAIKADLAQAAEGITYVSESDFPFKVVSASLPDGTTSITEEIVREKLAWVVDHDPDADKPMAKLFADSTSFADWENDFANCDENEDPGPEDCAKMQKLNGVIKQNLRDVKVFFFGGHGSPGNVDGTAVSVIVVGLSPKGNLVGVRTIAILDLIVSRLRRRTERW